MRTEIELRIDGTTEKISGQETFLSLSDFLRQIKFLKGTKVVCAEGDCGACTVMLKTPFDAHFKSANSCILPMFTLDQCEILTSDGLKQNEDPLNRKITEGLFEHLGTQCGFCTPGFIVQIRAMAEKKMESQQCPNSAEIVSGLSGNLCRCTGYESILKVAEQILGDKSDKPDRSDRPDKAEFNLSGKNAKLKKTSLKSALVKSENQEVFVAANLAEALTYKQANSQAVVVAGATDLAVKWNKGGEQPLQYLDLHLVEELYSFSDAESKHYSIGAHLSLSEMTKKINNCEINKLMDRFASEQIRNVGTLAGNIVNASPIGDTLPFLYALNAEIVLQSESGKRVLPIQKFILDYRKTALATNEIVTHILLPKLQPDCFLQLEKVSRRHFLDIANVSFAGVVQIKSNKIENLKLVYGGVGPTVLELQALAQSMIGKKWERKLFEENQSQIPKVIQARSDLRASAQYREKIAQNLFLNFFDAVEVKRSVLL